jgi:hypothetical protein
MRLPQLEVCPRATENVLEGGEDGPQVVQGAGGGPVVVAHGEHDSYDLGAYCGSVGRSCLPGERAVDEVPDLRLLNDVSLQERDEMVAVYGSEAGPAGIDHGRPEEVEARRLGGAPGSMVTQPA